MKYGEEMQKLMVKEWASFYLDYERLKSILDEGIANACKLKAAINTHDMRARLSKSVPFSLDVKTVAWRDKVGVPVVFDLQYDSDHLDRTMVEAAVPSVVVNVPNRASDVAAAEAPGTKLVRRREIAPEHMGSVRFFGPDVSARFDASAALARSGDGDANPLSVPAPVLTQLPRSASMRPAASAGSGRASSADSMDGMQMQDIEDALKELTALNHYMSVALRHELRKVERFYREQSQILCGAAGLCIDSAKMWDELSTSERKELRGSFHSVYFTLNKLQHYCEVNFKAVQKFLKKYDKNTKQNALVAYEDVINALPFKNQGPHNPIDVLRDDMTNAFGKYTLDGDLKLAKQIFHTEDKVDEVTREKVMATQSATAVGMCVALIAVVVTEFFSVPRPLDGYNTSAAPYWFGVTFTLLALPLLFSVNVMAWHHFGVNFSFIFDLHATKHWTGVELFRNHIVYLCIWLCCAYAFLRTHFADAACGGSPSKIPAWVWPYCIVPLWCIALAAQVVRNCIRLIPRQEWLLNAVGRMLVTPLLPVQFSEFFIADQLTSLGSMLFEVQFFWCYLHADDANGPCESGIGNGVFVLSILPHLWRFLQCLRKYFDTPRSSRRPHPHLVNATKYTTGIVAIIVGFLLHYHRHSRGGDATVQARYFIALVVFKSIETIFKIYWDTTMDFGILILQWETESFETAKLRRDSTTNEGDVIDDETSPGSPVSPQSPPKRRCVGFQFRHEVLYSPAWVYWVYPFVNASLRLAWIPAIFVGRANPDAYWVWVLFALVEIVRRFMWNFFRVENEQVNNLEGYRATNVIPKAPTSEITGLWDSTLENEERFARIDDVSDEIHGVSLGNLSRITRVFALLPEDEKVKICAIAFPERTFEGKRGEGKSKLFSELSEPTKVHVLVEHLGDERLNSYTKRLGFVDPMAASQMRRQRTRRLSMAALQAHDGDDDSPTSPAGAATNVFDDPEHFGDLASERSAEPRSGAESPAVRPAADDAEPRSPAVRLDEE